ncbi:unnamed protein product [Schistosoma curassoni]|uniref:Phosducin domain-containing protein n=1 Tax=Schistosoma curassoni TaxID=6186 RepID=A0A183KN47_9TREM|nr:unnamed protein product [Schistosoma curassoni]
MESSRPKEKKKTKEHITPRNGDRHERNEQELDGTRKEGGGQNLILIIYPDSIDKLEEINSVKYQFANCLQKYFDTIETRKVIGVDCFKIQIYINNNDVINAINEWKMSIIPIVYHIEDSGKMKIVLNFIENCCQLCFILAKMIKSVYNKEY